MKRAIFITLLAGLMLVPAKSQDEGSTAATEAGGRHQVSLLLGKGMFYQNISGLQLSRQVNNTAGQLPTVGGGMNSFIYSLNISDPNENSIMNMMGVEYKFHLNSMISLSLSGAGYINQTPWREAVDAVEGQGGTSQLLPRYANVDAQLRTRFVANLGGQYKFTTKVKRLHPYAGLLLTGQFAQLSCQTTYSGVDNLDLDAEDPGIRVGQMYSWAVSLTAGVEYDLLPALSCGFEIRPVSFYYTGIELIPQPGMAAMNAENLDWSIFAQPVFKISFRF